MNSKFAKALIFVVLSCLSPWLASANDTGKVTVHFEDATLKSVFESLERQSSYVFSYGDEILENQKPVSLNMSDTTVAAVLDAVFKGRNLEYKIVSDKSIIIKTKDAKTQSTSMVDVSGVVVDQTGEPVIGASVIVKGGMDGVLAKDKILIQVDKWKPYKEKIVEMARKHNCEKQIIVRTTTTSDYNNSHFGNLFENIILMPVLVCKGDTDDAKLDDFLNNYNCRCIALSFTRDDFPILNRIGEIKEKGYRIWLNSLWGAFNAGHDELALTDPDSAYGWLLNLGANVIFSDNPMLLKNYLISVNRRDF